VIVFSHSPFSLVGSWKLAAEASESSLKVVFEHMLSTATKRMPVFYGINNQLAVSCFLDGVSVFDTSTVRSQLRLAPTPSGWGS